MIYFPGCGTTTMSNDCTEKEKFASTIKNFISFVSRRCNKKSSSEDFIHPTLEEPLPKSHTDDKCPPKKSYFLSRGQQKELRKQVGSCPSKNENSAERIGRQSSFERSTSFGIHETTQKLFICGTGSNQTSSSTMTSPGTVVKQIKEKVAVLCCDKCDGCHETNDCPYYKKTREVHLDGQKNGWKLIGEYSTLPGAVLRMARIIPQAGDGSCLFHSMSYGIRDGSDASSLRKEICAYIQEHPQTPICKTPLSDWVQWDSGVTCADYARRMKGGAWGGGIEMACMSHLKGCNVHVYESSKSGGFKRISAFDHPLKPEIRKIVRVLYRGGVHYDALVPLV